MIEAEFPSTPGYAETIVRQSKSNVMMPVCRHVPYGPLSHKCYIGVEHVATSLLAKIIRFGSSAETIFPLFCYGKRSAWLTCSMSIPKHLGNVSDPS